jgi:hypothetical protein
MVEMQACWDRYYDEIIFRAIENISITLGCIDIEKVKEGKES